MLLIAVLFITSCNNDNDWDWPEGYTFATVMEDTEDEAIYFMMDNEQSFIVENNKSTVDINNLEVGQRVVVGITLYDDISGLYDYAADLYVVYAVKMGENVVVTTQEESDEIADDDFSYLVSNISLVNGYLNILAGYTTEDVDNVKFYLVENLVDADEADSSSNYLDLELRYDNASSEDAKTSSYESYISFDMESFSDKLEGKSGVKLRVKTIKSGTITVTIDSILY